MLVDHHGEAMERVLRGLLTEHARAALRRRFGTREPAATRERDESAAVLRSRGLVPHDVVLDFEEAWGGLAFPQLDTFGPGWQHNDDCWEVWRFGPVWCLDEGLTGPAAGGGGLVPVALGPSDYVCFMDAGGAVWGQDTVGQWRPMPTDSDGALFVSRTLVWCEMVTAGLVTVQGETGEEVARRLGLPRLERLTDRHCTCWGDGETFLLDRSVHPECDLDHPERWVVVASRDPSIR